MVVKVGILLAIVGVYFLSWSPGEIKWFGLFFVLMSTLTYGSYIVALNRPVLKRINPDVLTCYVMLFSAAFYFLVAVVQGKLEIVTRPAFVLDMFLLALLSTILSARLLVAACKINRSCTEFSVRDFRTFDSDYRWCFLFSRAIDFLELCRIDRCYCCGDDRHL